MLLLKLETGNPHLTNPREGIETKPNGTVRFVLVVDCDLDLRADASDDTPLGQALRDARALMVQHGYESLSLVHALP